MPGAVVVGTPRSYHKAFAFVLECAGIARGGFSKCSDVGMAIAKIEHWEGGSVIPDKSPGRMTAKDVTLERGAMLDHDLYDWIVQVINAAAGTGLKDPEYKRDVDIVQKDRDGSELRRWRLHGAWPIDFKGGAWDNTADAVVVEALVLTYDRPELVQDATA